MPGSLFHNLSPSFLWSTCWPGTLHFILHTPNHFLLFAAHLHTIATCFAIVPSYHSTVVMHLILVSLSTLYFKLSCSLTPHIHLTILISSWQLKCNLIFLSYGPGLTSMQHTTSHTTAVQSPSHYNYDISLLASNGTNCLNLFHPIQIQVSTTASASPSTVFYTQHVT